MGALTCDVHPQRDNQVPEDAHIAGQGGGYDLTILVQAPQHPWQVGPFRLDEFWARIMQPYSLKPEAKSEPDFFEQDWGTLEWVYEKRSYGWCLHNARPQQVGQQQNQTCPSGRARGQPIGMPGSYQDPDYAFGYHQYQEEPVGQRATPNWTAARQDDDGALPAMKKQRPGPAGNPRILTLLADIKAKFIEIEEATAQMAREKNIEVEKAREETAAKVRKELQEEVTTQVRKELREEVTAQVRKEIEEERAKTDGKTEANTESSMVASDNGLRASTTR